MAMRPLEVKIDADVRGAQRGLDTLSSSLDDVVRDLDQVADAGDDAARDLSSDFRNIARDAKRYGDDAGDGLKKGLKEGTDDFKQEAAQSGRETAASFSGGFDDVTDLVQEVAANAFAGFGPAGAAAGIAAAAGIGLVTAAFQASQEQAEKLKQDAADWAQAYIDSGGRVLTASTIIAKAQDILTDSDKWTEAQTNAENWGTSVETAAAAMAGSTTAIDQVKRSLDEQGAAADLAEQKVKNWGGANAGLAPDVAAARKSYDDGKAALDALTGSMSLGAQQADVYSYFLRDMAANTEGAITVTDEFGDKITTLPDGKTIYVDAETGQATDSLDAIETKQYSVNFTATATEADEEAERFRNRVERDKAPVAPIDADTTKADSAVKKSKDEAKKDVTFGLGVNVGGANTALQGLWDRWNNKTVTLKARIVDPQGRQIL